MSSQEKSDFCLQHCLSMENPIQVTLLDSAFRASLYEHAISAQTVTCYTFIERRNVALQILLFINLSYH